MALGLAERSLILALLGAACAAPPQLQVTSTTTRSEITYAGAPLLSEVHDWDPARAFGTFKVYWHVHGLHGEGPITKGEETGQYPHHRGLFVGWNRLQAGGRTWDFWHGKDGVHFLWRGTRADGDAAVSQVDWVAGDGQTVVRDERRVRVLESTPGRRTFEITLTLRCAAGPVQLLGDPHHAGFHFRAAEEVATRARETRIEVPAAARERKAGDRSILEGVAEAAERFTIQGRPYRIGMRSEVPCCWSLREYGRFGAFSEHRLEPGKDLVLRFWLTVERG